MLFFWLALFRLQILTGPTNKKRRLAVILDYRVGYITIILGECCPEKKQKYIVTIFIVGVFIHYRVCFSHNRGCLFIIVGAFSIEVVC